MKRAVITGATGFVARHLIPSLISAGWRVVGVARTGARPGWLPDIEWITADPGRWPDARDIIARCAPQAMIHLAGQVRGADAELCAANVATASHLLQAIRELSPDTRLVMFGSAAEYGAVGEEALPIDERTTCAPQGAYGATKLAATVLAQSAARSWNARVCIVRPFNIVGAHMSSQFVAGALLERIHAALTGGGEPITVGRTDTTRDFVDVGDLTSALVRLLEVDVRGEIINICSGRETRISDLLDATIALAGNRVTWKVDPSLIRPGDVARSFGSCAKARTLLGFEPRVSLEESLRAAWRARVAGRAP
jgi:GDP-4-dehydro-6-deoxy-D-mannose reductase